MLTEKMKNILSSARERGWVLEPEAKLLFSMAGLDVPRFEWAHDPEEAARFAQSIGYPVVAKIISPEVIHKSDVRGVEMGIQDAMALRKAFSRLSKMEGCSGVLVEEMVPGIELIIGAKIDYQFGPVILLGMGGSAVEIYRDVSLRMAPLESRDVESMARCLKAHRLLEGYRGRDPVALGELGKFLKKFSDIVMDLEKVIESIDLNPVMCSSRRCVAADARIMLKK
jgi:succinyl-CoA synthetase beta subunit